jgi:hypothetical protein
MHIGPSADAQAARFSQNDYGVAMKNVNRKYCVCELRPLETGLGYPNF